jgi:hypothetical protein
MDRPRRPITRIAIPFTNTVVSGTSYEVLTIPHDRSLFLYTKTFRGEMSSTSLWGHWVTLSVRGLGNIIRDVPGFPHFVQTNSGIAHQIRLRPLPIRFIIR